MGDPSAKAAQVGATFEGALLRGYIGCFSYAGVATLSEAPLDTLVKQFSRMQNIGKTSSPPPAVATVLCNGISACQSRSKDAVKGGLASPFVLYVAAAISVMAIVPFTLLYMEPAVNRKLLGLRSRTNRRVKAEHLESERGGCEDVVNPLERVKLSAGCVGWAGAPLAAVATAA